MKRLLPFILTFLSFNSYSQSTFSHYDSLRGSLNSLRSCYDVYFYDLTLDIDPEKKYISGSNTIYYHVVNDFDSIQVDLFNNLQVKKISDGKSNLPYRRDSNFIFIRLPGKSGSSGQLKIDYEGKPISAKKAPWDGGFVWTKDSTNNPWVGVACQGMGASLWWPCKDHFSDEPDSMKLSFSIPDSLYCASNGTLRNIQVERGKKRFEWFVHYPINTYNATVNIGNYTYWKDSLKREDRSVLSLEYYILKNNLEKAQRHFEQVKQLITCYEKYFGPYPFPKDGYALIETPYWGMEHQSAISYGNNYETDLLDFDFIIVHESAHEWWGNSLTAPDIGELWIHESFATYAEAILVEEYYGYQKTLQYLEYQKNHIKNKEPLVLPLGVNFFNSRDTDIYYKGSWVLHTLRNIVNNDSLWFGTLRKLAIQKRISIVSTEEIIHFFEKELQRDLHSFFSQYLYHTSLPVLEYAVKEKKKSSKLYYRWKTEVPDFTMPVIINSTNQKILLPGSTRIKSKKIKGVKIDDIFFSPFLQLIEIKRTDKLKE